MKAYMVLPSDFDCSRLSGTVDFFKIGEPVIYASIDEAIKSFPNFDSKKHFIAHVEFTDDYEVLQAVMSAYMGNTWCNFKLRLLEVVSFQKNEAA